MFWGRSRNVVPGTEGKPQEPDDSRAGTHMRVEGVMGEERQEDEGSAGVQLEEQMPRVPAPICCSVNR